MEDRVRDLDINPAKWRFATRVLFRFAFVFFTLDALFGGTASPLALLPWVGDMLDATVRRPMSLFAQWAGIHLFHLTGPAANLHIQATSDGALSWVTVLIMLAIAVVTTGIWTALDRKRPSYEVLFRWFRFLLRVTLGVALLRYGFIKVFPIQFPAPALAVLNEPVGNASPTMLFWTLYGLHPAFEMILGWIEVTAGLLLLFRRSSFAGAVLAFLTVVNVAFMDCTFDVPVKLYSLSLVAMSTALLAPEFCQLGQLFSSQQIVVREVTWGPQLGSRLYRSLLIGVELLLTILACWQFSTGTHSVWATKSASAHAPASITGGWRIEHGSPALVGGDGSPVVSIYFDPNSDSYLRASDGSLWRARAIYDREHHHLRMLYEVVGMWMFSVEQPDPDHLILKPMGPTASQLTTLHMARISLPATYPLLEERFHWIDEFGGLR